MTPPPTTSFRVCPFRHRSKYAQPCTWLFRPLCCTSAVHMTVLHGHWHCNVILTIAESALTLINRSRSRISESDLGIAVLHNECEYDNHTQRMRKLLLIWQTTGPAEARFLADPPAFWQTHRRCSFAHAFPFSVLMVSTILV